MPKSSRSARGSKDPTGTDYYPADNTEIRWPKATRQPQALPKSKVFQGTLAPAGSTARMIQINKLYPMAPPRKTK